MSYDMTLSEANYEAAEPDVERVYCKHESCIALLADEQATICARCKEPFCEGHIYEVVGGVQAGKFFCSHCEDAVLDEIMDKIAPYLSESEEADRDQNDWDSGAYRG